MKRAREFSMGLACLVLVGMVGWGFPRSATAQGESAIPHVPGRGKAGPKSGGKAGKDKKKPDFPKFKEVTKDHKEVLGPQGSSGFFPLYFNKKTDQLLGVIPKKMLKKNFLISVSISGGPFFAGWMWGDAVVQWHEMGKKLVLIMPDLRYKDGGKSPVADVIQRTYTDRILLSTKIVTKRNGDPVIDMGDVFKKDFAQVGKLFRGRINPSLTRWSKQKVFPLNDELAVDAAIMQGEGGGIRARIHYSLVQLPTDNGYKSREADSRIGFFLTAVKDWTVPHDADTVFKRYIHRWDVRKAEPDKAVSDVDPEHQIVYYIEKTVPVKYRRFVREGILSWNKAFEKAGIRNAVRVEQQTEKVHADKDPEDVRYAFFRWIVSGRSFAMGPSLANPLTGEILDADIIFDDSMARAWEMQYARYSGTGLSGMDDPQLEEFLTQNPEWGFVPMQQRLLPESTRYAGVDMRLDPAVRQRLADKAGYCNYAVGLAHEMAFTSAFLDATGNEGRDEEYVGQLIRHVVAHEVGHTLGLRHNFKATTWKKMDEILSTDDPNVPNSGSVMDYTPGVFQSDPKDQKLFVMQTVGPYDEWAISYGYASHKGTDYKDEAALLKSITDRVAEDGLDYGTDEDTMFFSPDPLCNRYDQSSDPIAYAKQRMDMVRRLQKDMDDWAIKDGKSYDRLRRLFNMFLFEYSRVARFSARFVGGQYMHRDHKGDPNARPPIEVVPAAKQREALDFLVDTVLGDKDFNFSPDLLNKLAAGRWWHWDTDALDTQLDYPLHDRIAAVQWLTLFQLMNPFTLNRIYDAQLKVPADRDAMTIPEVLGRLTGAVWAELDGRVASTKYTDRKPLISSVRRSLQRQHLNMLITIVLSNPGRVVAADVHAVAALTLKELSERIGSLLSGSSASKLDDFTRAHLDESKSRIDRALEAKYEL